MIFRFHSDLISKFFDMLDIIFLYYICNIFIRVSDNIGAFYEKQNLLKILYLENWGELVMNR